MKDLFNNIFSLGIGLAVASKEQIEKAVDELVEKGKVTREESEEIIDELIKKGQGTQEKMDSIIKERMNELLSSMNIVTKNELDQLKERVAHLEEQIKELQEKNVEE